MAAAEHASTAGKSAVKSAKVADFGLIASADMAVVAVAGVEVAEPASAELASAELIVVDDYAAVVVHAQMAAEKFAVQFAAEPKAHWMVHHWKLELGLL